MLCAVLVEARKEVNLTQRELAARLRVPTTVSRVETGERRLDVLEMLLWAKALERSLQRRSSGE